MESFCLDETGHGGAGRVEMEMARSVLGAKINPANAMGMRQSQTLRMPRIDQKKMERKTPA